MKQKKGESNMSCRKLCVAVVVGSVLSGVGAFAAEPAVPAAGGASGVTGAYTPGKGYTIKFSENQRLTIGGDEQLRLEYYDRSALCIEGYPENGPAMEYVRARERLWMRLDLADNLFAYMRLVHRWQYYSSRPAPGSNNNNAYGTAEYAAWAWPDEVIFDNLFIDYSKIGGTGWSVRLGRQELVDYATGAPLFGNAMVLLEGTPADTGRTIYFDGAVVRWDGEKDHVKFFGFYDTYRDQTVVINDRERTLNMGNTGVVGADATHQFSKALNLEAYYMYVDIDDAVGTPGHFSIAGGRVFGAPEQLNEQVDYSLEYAQQFGEFMDTDISGMMVDARLGFTGPKDTPLDPKLSFECTYFSGDKPSTTDYEGWLPVFDAYPIWREELLPQSYRGAWSNMYQYRAELKLRKLPVKGLTCAAAYAWLQADQPDCSNPGNGGQGGFGSGRDIGQLVSAFVDYRVTPWLMFSFQSAAFFPGNHYEDGHNSKWLRFETTFTF